MSVMFILLPVALIFSGAALLVFVWAARAGQFDDLETPGLRILHEDEDAAPPASAAGDAQPAHRLPVSPAGAKEAPGNTAGTEARSRMPTRSDHA